MKYVSTRSCVNSMTFEETLFTGFPSFSGLAVPDYAQLKPLAEEKLRHWTSELSYSQILSELLKHFIDDAEIDYKDIEEISRKSCLKFSSAEVVPVKELADDLFLAELFHGPTLAFKDLALTILGALLDHFLKKRQKHITVLVGTSGDTGSSAIHSVKDLPWIDIIVLYPKGRCSLLQELQMTTVPEKNVHCFEVDGSTDDLDVPIKACFSDPAFVQKHNLCSVNSTNLTRILVQAAHFFYLHGKVCKMISQDPFSHRLTIVIPTGGAGHLTAALLAKQLGLQIDIVCCVNANDVFHKMYTSGQVQFSRVVQPTLACAMDIQAPYNMERIFYLLSEGNHSAVKNWMKTLETYGELQLPTKLHEKIKEGFHVHKASSDDVIKDSMLKTWQTYKYRTCPHTAIAMDYYFNKGCNLKNVHVVMATASYLKFPEANSDAGVQEENNSLKEELEKLPTRNKELGPQIKWESNLRTAIEEISYYRENK